MSHESTWKAALNSIRLLEKKFSYNESSNLDILLKSLIDDWDTWHSFDSCISLVHENFWWHISNLEVVICPTTDSQYLSINNPSLCLFGTSKRVKFSSMLKVATFRHSMKLRLSINLSFIAAYAKYRLALLKIERAKDNKIHIHIDTGSGPIMVTPDGYLTTIPFKMCLKLDGSLVEKDDINEPSVELEDTQ